MIQHKMIEINLLCRTINDEQYNTYTSPEETYRTALRKTVVVMNEAQVRLFDVLLHPSSVEVVILHLFINKCSRPGL